jgi:hypothetical protein
VSLCVRRGDCFCCFLASKSHPILLLLLDLEGSAERRRLSSLSLGLVNDFVNEFEQEDDDDDEEEVDPRQGQGDELVSSSSKWHKHTVKVFDMLRRNMPDPPDVLQRDLRPRRRHPPDRVRGVLRAAAAQDVGLHRAGPRRVLRRHEGTSERLTNVRHISSFGIVVLMPAFLFRHFFRSRLVSSSTRTLPQPIASPWQGLRKPKLSPLLLLEE